MSLRRRLVVGVLALLAVAISVADVVTYSSLRSFLYGRLDEQLEVTQAKAYRYIEGTYFADVAAGYKPSGPPALGKWLAELAVSGSCGAVGADGADGSAVSSGRIRTLHADALIRELNPDVYVEVLDQHGRLLLCDPSGTPLHPDPAPRLPAHLPVQSHPANYRFGGGHGPFVPARPSFNTGAVHGGTSYRGQAIALPGGTLVTAISTAPTEQTLTSLLHVELLVTAAVVLAAVLVALLVVRLGLSPLDDMTATAGAIAAGDLTARVRHSDERTEVGRLGRALNGMLSQIEAAFGQRRASEDRLRRFVADASHELRTPLTTIRGYAELLRSGAIGDDRGRLRAASRIEQEAARMGLLVDDLLLLARLDQGRPFEVASVDLGRLARRAAEDARAAHPARPLSIDVEHRVVVDGDAGRLRQVVDNLIANAVVHTPPQTPVRVSVKAVGERARLVVSDDGPGMTAEHSARVFERFYRGSTERTSEGAGLGLSIVAAIAAAHGGSARVESATGRGATFTVDLPLHLEDAGSDPRTPLTDHAVTSRRR